MTHRRRHDCSRCSGPVHPVRGNLQGRLNTNTEGVQLPMEGCLSKIISLFSGDTNKPLAHSGNWQCNLAELSKCLHSVCSCTFKILVVDPDVKVFSCLHAAFVLIPSLVKRICNLETFTIRHLLSGITIVRESYHELSSGIRNAVSRAHQYVI